MNGKQRFEALDGLRGVAALAVLITHASQQMLGHGLLPHGHLAVDFFFMLSGFVVAHAYGGRLEHGLGASAFLVQRIARLQPLVVLGALVGAVASLFDAHPPLRDLALAILPGILALPAPRLHSVGFGLWPLDPPTWSLFWEYAINIVFGLWLYRWRTAGLCAVVATGLLALVAVALQYGSLDAGFAVYNLWGAAARVGFSFTLGVVLYRLRSAGRLPDRSLPTPLLAAILAGVLVWPGRAYSAPLELAAAVLIFPAIVTLGANLARASAPWRWAGALSYPVYILHVPVVLLVKQAHLPPVIGMATSLVTAIASGWLALKIYDEPVQKWLKQRLAAAPGERLPPAAGAPAR